MGGALVLAVVAGLVVPKLFSHHKAQAATVVTKTRGHTTTSTTLPTAPATTQAPTPTTVASTPTTATPTTAAPTTAPGTSGSSGTSGTTGTSGNSGTTGTSGSGGGNGRTVHNPQVEVTLSPGWSVNSKSSSTLLILNGPNSTSAGFHSEAALPATSLESAVAALESSTEQLGTGAKVCIPAQPTTIPGRIPGADFGICLTTTPQGAAANPIEVVDFVALKQVGTGRRLYVVELVFPQAISSASFKADYGPLLNSVQWATT